ncbi:MAG: sodium-dependent transporter [Archaeoglobaceae archaeon]
MVREEWGSRLGFLLAGVGSAVGLGNVWRFSYIVGQNGGGAFLVPYLVSIIAFGLPLMMLEFSVGRHFKGSVVSCMRKIKDSFRWVGVVIVAVNTVVLSYYLVITGWTVAFLSLTLLRSEMDFNSFSQTYYTPLFFIIVAFITAFVVMRGVKSGIEKTSKIMIPSLGILLMGMVVYALTLPNAVDGILFYFKPDLSMFNDYSMWSAAFGQAFFSLSVGSGILLTYGSYLDDKESLVSNSVIITFFDLMISIVSAVIVFSIVFSFSLEPAAGPNLAFSTLPHVFSSVPYGMVLAAVFYLLLFFAALTSSISMFEVTTAAFIDEARLSRAKSSMILLAILLVLGLPSALSYSGMSLQLDGIPVLDHVDQLFGSVAILFTALLISVSVTWFFDNRIIKNQINKNARWNVGNSVFVLVKYIIPIALFYVLAARIFNLVI